MLSTEESKFLDYWEKNRERKKKVYRQLSVGLPTGAVLVIAIFINVFSGWYTRALMTYNGDKSILLVLLLGGIGITTFFTIYSARHRWDQNEQKYKELLQKKKKRGSESDHESV